MMIRNADGTVDHDGEYNPCEEINGELADKCKATGGFVMSTGIAHFSPIYVGINKNGNIYTYSSPAKYTGDGLMYVMGRDLG